MHGGVSAAAVGVAGVAGAGVGASRAGGHVVVEDLTLATGVVLPHRRVLESLGDGRQDGHQLGQLLLGGLKLTRKTIRVTFSPKRLKYKANCTVPIC